MKKLFLLSLLVVSIHLNTNAQNDLLDDAVYKASVTRYINYPYKMTSVTTIHYLSDSTGIVKDYAYYMKKSKDLRTAGLITLGTGLALSGIGLLMTDGSSPAESESSFGFAIMGLGALFGIVSIPLMISGHTNRYKARTMLKKQKTGFGVPSNVSKDITGITMTIPL